MTHLNRSHPFQSAVSACALAIAALSTTLSSQAAQGQNYRNQVKNQGGVSYQTSSSLEGSYSASSDIHRGTALLGDLESIYTAASYKSVVSKSQQLKWSVGIDWRRFSFSRPDAAPIPHTLQSASLPLGIDYSFNDTWAVRAEISPGVYSDFEDISWSDINIPALVGVSYVVDKDLILVAQVSLDAWSNNPVMGGVGVRWQFAEQWLLSLLFPKPRVEYTLNDKTTLFAGARFLGGSYRVAKDFGQQHSEPSLDGQKTDYREIRAGVGVVYKLGDEVTLELDGGWMIDRRFHFHNRDLLLNGDGAPYASLAFVARY